MKKHNLKTAIGRRVCALLLAAVTAFSVTACGGENPGSNNQQEEKKEWVYVPEFISIEDENVRYYNMKLSGDKLYYVSWNWDEETMTSSENLCFYSLEDKKIQEMSFKWPEDSEYNSIGEVVVAEDGSVYSYMQIYNEEEGEKQFICKFDAEGNWLFTKELGKGPNGESLSYVQNMILDNQGRLYLTGSDNVVQLVDSEGNTAGFVSVGSGDTWINEICKDGEGKVYAVYTAYDGNGSSTILAEIDFEGKKVGATYNDFPNGARYIIPGTEGNLLISDDSKVYAYDLDKQQKTLLYEWLDCDINGNYVECFGQLEDGRMLAVIQDWESDDNGVALLTRKKASEVPEKENITIATISSGYELRNLAVKFNKASDKYHINVKEYIDRDNWNENSWSDAITNLNNDITSSNTPDIIDLSNLNIEQLASKGVFEDLNEYLERSSVISRSDFLENILDAYTYNDRLVSIPAKFMVQTVMGHKSKIGDKKGWTLQEMVEYADANPDAELFDRVSKGEILQGLLMMNADEFIDWSTGECRFDTDAFKSLLQFTNRYPDEVEWNGDSEVTPIRIQKGEVLLYTDTLYDFRSIQEALDMFNQDAVCIGYPTVDGSSGHAMTGRYTYAIASKSDCKEGAWAFIESVLGNVDDDRFSNGFPSNKAKLDAMAAEAVKIEYVLDENGEPYLDENGEPIIQGAGGGIGWGDWFYEYHNPTQAEVDIVMDIIKEAKPMSYEGNDQIMSIVLEEAEPFFKGQKTVDEVTVIIQNRVKIYIDENR